MAAALLVAFVVVLAAARPAYGHPSPGATYAGTIAGGGTIQFTVSSDGTHVNGYEVTGFPAYPCATSIDERLTGTLPIGAHPAHGWGTQSITGTFPALQQAKGSFRFRQVFPSCATPAQEWTATTTAPPPPACGDGEDNDADGKADHPVDPGCTAPSDPDEADLTAPPTGTPTPTSPGTDRVAPALALSGKATQRIAGGRTLAVTATCGAEPCTITARGELRVRGSVYKLRTTKATLAAGDKVTLRLKVSSKTLAVVRRALRARRVIRVRVTVAAVDAAGNRATRNFDLRVRA